MIKHPIAWYCLPLLITFQAWQPLLPAIKVVLTGAPGVGKTTLINELKKRGFNVVNEVATIIIQQALKQGLPHPARDIDAVKIFIDDICRMQKTHEQTLQDNKLYFLDRGLHDPIAFYKFYNLRIPTQLLEAATNASYAYVFLLDFLDVYENTEVRRESNETSKILQNLTMETYQQYGYEMDINLFCVPQFLYDEQHKKLNLQESVNRRINFILEQLTAHAVLLISKKTACKVNPKLQQE